MRHVSLVAHASARARRHQSWTGHTLWAVLVAWLSGCAPYLGDSDAALALEDIAAGTGASRLKARTPEPARREIGYRVDGRRHRADLYHPGRAPEAGIVLVPGVVAEGKDDPRLVALARTLARLRFAVLVPELPSLRRLHVGTQNIVQTADAFRYLVSRPELAPGGRAGMAGFSYGAGPVLLAALEPGIRDRVRFVVALGGYHDLEAVITYLTTGYYRVPAAPARPQGRWRYLAPHPYSAWIFALFNADLLTDPDDRAIIKTYTRQMLAGHRPPAASTAGLSPAGQAVLALLTNDDPQRVPALLDRLPEPIRAEIDGLNPAVHALSKLRAQLLLVHGRQDNMIPYTQSLALARALPAEQVQLFIVDGLIHVEIDVGARDVPTLVRAMKALLAQREPGAPKP